MSNSKHLQDQPRYRLQVSAPQHGLGVLVIDSQGSIVGRCKDDQGLLVLELPAGLYIVRSHRSGNLAETVVRLDTSRALEAPLPAVYSAALIPGALTTHEYYTYPSWEASFNPTAPDLEWDGPVCSGLLLFTRAPNQSLTTGDDQLLHLSLETLDGCSLTSFPAEQVRNDKMGWSAYSVRLSAGTLLLNDASERARQIPIPLLPGWQTQIFVIHHAGLLWQDMRLSLISDQDLATRSGRSPYDMDAADVRTAISMDVGLLALQNNAPSVWPQLAGDFLDGPCNNPLLGLLAAYLMVLQLRQKVRRPVADSMPSAGQLKQVLDRLQAMIPDSADIAALRFLAQDAMPQSWMPVTTLPLFRLGADTLLKENDKHPERELLPISSPLLAIKDYLYGDTVWTTWQPTRANAIQVKFEAGAPDALPDVRININSSLIHPGGQFLAQGTTSMLTRQSFVDKEEFAVSSETSVNATAKPDDSLIYRRLKEVLADFVPPGSAEPSADTLLSELLPPDDTDGLFWLSRRITRCFRDFNVKIPETELADACSVKDVARKIKQRSHASFDSINQQAMISVAPRNQMLTGSDLVAKVKELGDVSKSDLVRSCGYLSTKKDGTERLNFTAFYEALLEAKGLSFGEGGKGRGKAGRSLSYVTKVQFNGNLMVGKAYTAQLGLQPGDEFEIKLGRKQIKLIPLGSTDDDE
jgi:hypothetical protein